MGRLTCPSCESKEIKINKYHSDNIFGFTKEIWFEQTGRWVCENCGTFIKKSPSEKPAN